MCLCVVAKETVRMGIFNTYCPEPSRCLRFSLMHQVAAILNAKKRRIRELEAQTGAREAGSPAASASDDEPEELEAEELEAEELEAEEMAASDQDTGSQASGGAT